jgi:hypothetical protein
MPDLYLTTFRGEVTVCKDGEEDVTVSEREACRRILAHDALADACRKGLDGMLAAFPHAERIRDILAPLIADVRAAIANADGK